MPARTQVEPGGLELMGRRYGHEQLSAEQWSGQAVSDVGVFAELSTSIRNQSALLALTDRPTREIIYTAYTQDLELLRRYQTDFDACIKAAVRCSIIANSRTARQERERCEATWDLLKTQLPSSMQTLLIDFPYTRAALPVPQLLIETQDEFNHGVEQILEPLAEWLQMLVETEFIGLVEWGDLDVCRYHYFKHEITREVRTEQRRVERSFDPKQPYGSRNHITLIRDQNILQRQFHERHVHHIIRAKLHQFAEYPHRVPRHVAAFINGIPASLQPHMHIVEGTITKEEVFRRQVGEEQFVKSEVLSVDKYSPGVLLGHFNLIGWSGDDLKSGSIFYRIQQAVQRQARKQRTAERHRRFIGHLFTA